ncbi:hypothetical protein B0H13DRAFT_2673631 [Mycena leptocephala]|nr:hypothetical protein B0H13DRAFT_2673631 [Mycena leptocephala]
MPEPSQPSLPMPLPWWRPFHAIVAEATRKPVVLKAALPLWYLRPPRLPPASRDAPAWIAHRQVLSETDGRRLGPPCAPRRIPEAQVPYDGNVVFPPSLRTSQSVLLARPTTPLAPRSSSPRSSTSPIIERP